MRASTAVTLCIWGATLLGACGCDDADEAGLLFVGGDWAAANLNLVAFKRANLGEPQPGCL